MDEHRTALLSRWRKHVLFFDSHLEKQGSLQHPVAARVRECRSPQSPLIVNRRNRWGSYERCAIDANVAMQVGDQQCVAVDAKVQDAEARRTCARATSRLR